MAEFLLELFSEEIPAGMQARAAAELERLVTAGLKQAGLAWTATEAQVTPRRLTLWIDGLPLSQPDLKEERKGPRVDAPEKAIWGFLKSAGLESVDQCKVREIRGNEFYFLIRTNKGLPTSKVIPSILRPIFWNFPWPKSMRWPGGRFRWIRPLQQILCLFDGQIVDIDLSQFTIDTVADFDSIDRLSELGPSGDVTGLLKTTNKTIGHRFLAPDAVPVSTYAEYKQALTDGFVMLDREARKAAILKQATKLAKAEGLRLRDDPGLVDEVAGLVEWPVAHLGRIDDAFMDVPPEVLITSMRSHQRYLAVEAKDGSLAPRFVLVANRPTDDGGAAVVEGNERVLRARLSDAKYFWDQDRKVKLENRVPALKKIIFHAKLGNMEEKVERVRHLARVIAQSLEYSGEQEMMVNRTALLAKADLTTSMVGEFPGLQGVMGRYYALAEGETEKVADAVSQHYSPLGPNDSCPTAPIAVAVALADKIDTLVGLFAINEMPTGRGDPYALRRAALGVIRLIIENKLRLHLAELIMAAYKNYLSNCMDRAVILYREEGFDNSSQKLYFEKPHMHFHELIYDNVLLGKTHTITGPSGKADYIEADFIAKLAPHEVVKEFLFRFFADRLKVVLREKGVRHDLVDAVFALSGEDDLVRLLARVEALGAFLDSEDGANLLVAYRRAANIVRRELEKDGVEKYEDVNKDFYRQPEERTLWMNLLAVQDAQLHLLKREHFVDAMTMLASLRPYVDSFFDNVMVNDEEDEVRLNRLALLQAIIVLMNQLADFSKIEG